ncbi:MAG TPA: hypothetical protein VFH48_15890 [Chloroflexota bacterium]|nr:hypothetical protein [Chloroflexota bacterium]
MRVGRLILVVSTLVTILLFPLLLRDAVQALRLPSAYAAPSIFDPAGRLYQNGNTNQNDNDVVVNDPNNDDDDDANNENDDESDNEGEDNEGEDIECFLNLNDNEPVPCDFEDNDNDVPPPPSAAPPPSSGGGFQPVSKRCFGAGETGEMSLVLEGGSVIIRVVNQGFPQGTWVALDDIPDLTGIPGPPAGTTMLDRMIWRLDAGSSCDGPAVNPLPAAVNLGVPYNVSADKSKLQIVILKNNVWQEVPTVPDPVNPYISATVTETGIYAVVQKP